MNRKIIAIGVVVVAITATAIALSRRSDTEPTDEAPLRTAEVTRTTLVDSLDVLGTIGFGDVQALRYTAKEKDAGGLGLVTWLPAVGTTVHRGESLLRVDERPVLLLYGSLPLFRTLKTGVTGSDVEQLETNLHALGYTGFTVDQEFTDATASALRQWQKTVGLPTTGTIDPGQVLFAADAVRVAEQRIHVGDVADGDILGYTGAVPSVSAKVELTTMRGQVTTGTAVTVLVDDGQGAGTVRRVAPPAGADQGPPSVQVDVAVTDPKLLQNRLGNATIRFVLAEHKDVLAVPVVALVALAEGGYGVQVVEGASTRYVAVTTGLFARGMVEVTGGDVQVGTKVVVP